MNDMFRIRYQVRHGDRKIDGVLTSFCDNYQQAIRFAEIWLEQVYGQDLDFDLSDAGRTFKY